MEGRAIGHDMESLRESRRLNLPPLRRFLDDRLEREGIHHMVMGDTPALSAPMEQLRLNARAAELRNHYRLETQPESAVAAPVEQPKAPSSMADQLSTPFHQVRQPKAPVAARASAKNDIDEGRGAARSDASKSQNVTVAKGYISSTNDREVKCQPLKPPQAPSPRPFPTDEKGREWCQKIANPIFGLFASSSWLQLPTFYSAEAEREWRLRFIGVILESIRQEIKRMPVPPCNYEQHKMWWRRLSRGVLNSVRGQMDDVFPKFNNIAEFKGWHDRVGEELFNLIYKSLNPSTQDDCAVEASSKSPAAVGGPIASKSNTASSKEDSVSVKKRIKVDERNTRAKHKWFEGVARQIREAGSPLSREDFSVILTRIRKMIPEARGFPLAPPGDLKNAVKTVVKDQTTQREVNNNRGASFLRRIDDAFYITLPAWIGEETVSKFVDWIPGSSLDTHHDGVFIVYLRPPAKDLSESQVHPAQVETRDSEAHSDKAKSNNVEKNAVATSTKPDGVDSKKTKEEPVAKPAPADAVPISARADGSKSKVPKLLVSSEKTRADAAKSEVPKPLASPEKDAMDDGSSVGSMESYVMVEDDVPGGSSYIEDDWLVVNGDDGF